MRDSDIKDKEAAAKKRRDSDKENDEDPGPVDVLGEQEDQDVIF